MGAFKRVFKGCIENLNQKNPPNKIINKSNQGIINKKRVNLLKRA
ncbi:hypothetical protein HPHPA16_0450 [Helicobacter pylori Hp A-16]|nr:hypothetical protein HPHPA16_0450 [Helicobacter pylori Hp A-16]